MSERCSWLDADGVRCTQAVQARIILHTTLDPDPDAAWYAVGVCRRHSSGPVEVWSDPTQTKRDAGGSHDPVRSNSEGAEQA